MCRIFGISYNTKKPVPEKLSTGQIARILGCELVHGGPHAFGWMQNVDGLIDVRKFSGRIDEQLSKLNSIRRECDWFVGHVRYATHGDSENLNNVHPISHYDIVGVHNGVLSNHERVLQECGGRYLKNTQVDSEAIFAAVHKFGHLEGLAKIYGSMVTVYADRRKPASLFIARSNSRMLRIGWTSRGNLIFASEQNALDALAEAGIEFESFSGISENRVLRIMDGQIKDRATFRPPASQFPAREARNLAREALIAQAAADELDDAVRNLQRSLTADRATRRGELLFPSGRRRIPEERLASWHRDHHSEATTPDKPKRPKKRQAQEVGHIVGDGKVKYKGTIMSQDEYISARAADLRTDAEGLADAVIRSASETGAISEEDWE